MSFIGFQSRFFVYIKGILVDRLKIQDVYIVMDLVLVLGDVSICQGGIVMVFFKVDGVVGKGVQVMSVVYLMDGLVMMKDWVVIVGEGIVDVEEMLIFVWYIMG